MTRLQQWLEADHRRLEELLDRAAADPDAVDHALFTHFRTGLLRHISMEERVLIPLVRRLHGDAHPAEKQVRLDHGAIAALLVPPPSRFTIAALRAVLARHNPLEEGPDALYAVLDELSASAADEMLVRAMDVREVPLSPNIDNPGGLVPARRAMERAGHDPAEFDEQPPSQREQ